METEINKGIIEAFWVGVPDGTTWDDLAEGKDIEFTYEHKKYKINTSAGAGFRTRSMMAYQEGIEKMAIIAVKGAL